MTNAAYEPLPAKLQRLPEPLAPKGDAFIKNMRERHFMVAERETYITLDTGNVAYIEGTTTKVLEVAEAKATHHLTPEALQRELPHLSLAQVYAALAYYHAHKPEVDAQIAERYAYADGLRRTNPNPWTREQLLARRGVS